MQCGVCYLFILYIYRKFFFFFFFFDIFFPPPPPPPPPNFVPVISATNFSSILWKLKAPREVSKMLIWPPQIWSLCVAARKEMDLKRCNGVYITSLNMCLINLLHISLSLSLSLTQLCMWSWRMQCIVNCSCCTVGGWAWLALHVRMWRSPWSMCECCRRRGMQRSTARSSDCAAVLKPY